MGFDLKRVPMDFSWPLNKPYIGYINPHYQKSHKCQDCDGSGSTTAGNRLSDLVSLLLLSGSDAQRGACHPYFREMHLHRTLGVTPSVDMMQLTAGLAGRAPSFMGHDCRDKWQTEKKIIAAAGLPEDWGTCQTCKGEGEIWKSDQAKTDYENWNPEQPPEGDGYQIWENVSEGSPISPVFATPEELANHMENNPWAGGKSSFDTWLKFINGPGYAPSIIVENGVVKSGVEAAF